MLPPIGKATVIKNPDQAQRIHESVADGKKLDTSKFNYTPKKSVRELLGKSRNAIPGGNDG